MLEDLKYNWKWTADPEYPREEVAKPGGSKVLVIFHSM